MAELSNRNVFSTYKVLKVRDITTVFGHYMAVLADTDAGQKVVLLRAMKTNGWYWKVYDGN